MNRSWTPWWWMICPVPLNQKLPKMWSTWCSVLMTYWIVPISSTIFRIATALAAAAACR